MTLVQILCLCFMALFIISGCMMIGFVLGVGGVTLALKLFTWTCFWSFLITFFLLMYTACFE